MLLPGDDPSNAYAYYYGGLMQYRAGRPAGLSGPAGPA